MYDNLTDDNFLIYCAKVYDNPQCHSTEEFVEDINRIKYIKKLVARYIEKGELKERLILNHIIILNNVFGPEQLNKILYLKMKKQFIYIKPFLVLLNIMQDKIENIDNEKVIYLDSIDMDEKIVNILRKVNESN